MLGMGGVTATQIYSYREIESMLEQSDNVLMQQNRNVLLNLGAME